MSVTEPVPVVKVLEPEIVTLPFKVLVPVEVPKVPEPVKEKVLLSVVLPKVRFLDESTIMAPWVPPESVTAKTFLVGETAEVCLINSPKTSVVGITVLSESAVGTCWIQVVQPELEAEAHDRLPLASVFKKSPLTIAVGRV